MKKLIVLGVVTVLALCAFNALLMLQNAKTEKELNSGTARPRGCV